MPVRLPIAFILVFALLAGCGASQRSLLWRETLEHQQDPAILLHQALIANADLDGDERPPVVALWLKAWNVWLATKSEQLHAAKQRQDVVEVAEVLQEINTTARTAHDAGMPIERNI